MLKIEVIKFEAQDVITASGVAHEHEYKRTVVGENEVGGQIVKYVCECGEVKKF